ncbi:hypothetical protein [Planotetraspora silvatica]|nr:hypothetical protein [Planotetraspora silvatica]
MAWTRPPADTQNSAAAATPPPSFGRSPVGEETAWAPEEEPAYSWFSPPQAEAHDAEVSDRLEDTNQFRAIQPSDSFPPFQAPGTPLPAPHHAGPEGMTGTPGRDGRTGADSTPGAESATGAENAPAPGNTPLFGEPGRHALSRPSGQGAFAAQPEDPPQPVEHSWSDGIAVQPEPVREPDSTGQPFPTPGPYATHEPYTAQDAYEGGYGAETPGGDPHAPATEPGGHAAWPPPWTPPPNLEDRSRPWSPDPGVGPADETLSRDGSWPARHAAWPAPEAETYGTSQPNPAPEAYTPAPSEQPNPAPETYPPTQAYNPSVTYGPGQAYEPLDPHDPLGPAGRLGDVPAHGVPVSGTPVFGAPVYDTPLYDVPSHDVPSHDAPVHGASAPDRFDHGSLVPEAPILGAPVYDSPVQETPGHGYGTSDRDPQSPDTRFGDASTGAGLGETAEGAADPARTDVPTRPAEPGDVPVWPPRLTDDEAPAAEGRHLHHEAPPVEHEAAAIEVADARAIWPLGTSAHQDSGSPTASQAGLHEPLPGTAFPGDAVYGDAPAGRAAMRDDAPSGAPDQWGSGGGEGISAARSLWPRPESDPSEPGPAADEAIALAITPTAGFPPLETGIHALPIEEPSGSQPPQSPSPHMTPGQMPPAPTPQNPASAPTTPFAFTPVTPPKAATKALAPGFDSLGSPPDSDFEGPATTPQPKVPVLPGPPPDLPPVSQDDRGRPATGMTKRVLLTACGAVVIGVIGAAAFYAYTGQSPTGATTAATTAAPSTAGTPDVDEAPAPKPTAATILDSQKTDPRNMLLTEAFPESRVSVAGRTFRRVKIGSTDTCGAAATGTFAVALQKQKCSRVLRATYVDAKKQYAVTTGIAVLPTKQAALTVDRSKNLGGNQWFRGLDGTAETATDRVTISGGYAAGMVWGRYIVFSYATYADGHTPEAKDKSLGPVSAAFRDHTAEVLAKRITR